MIATPHQAREQKDLANTILDRVKKLNPGNEGAWDAFSKSALALGGRLQSLEKLEAATGITPACEKLEVFLSTHKIPPAISCSEMNELAMKTDYTTTTIVELYQELLKLDTNLQAGPGALDLRVLSSFLLLQASCIR